MNLRVGIICSINLLECAVFARGITTFDQISPREAGSGERPLEVIRTVMSRREALNDLFECTVRH